MPPNTEQTNLDQNNPVQAPQTDVPVALSAPQPDTTTPPPNSQPANPQVNSVATAQAQAQASVPAPAPVYPTPNTQNSPLLIVLQWLTYAFWGWTILGMSALTISVLANFISGAETGGFTPYGIAAVLVLLPISIACDVFYSKQEPQKKTGAASIVMVIHAVIFALFGIGAVIAIVFSLINMLTSSSDTTNMKVSLYSAMIIAVLYGAVFLRTINPQRIPMVRRFFIMFMTAIVGVIAILGIVGPMAHERATRNDRLISSNLPYVNSAIQDYARDKKKLPDSLNDVELNGDAKVLVEKNLVKYTANLKQPSKQSTTTTSRSRSTTSYAAPTTFYYQLCVNYAKKSKTSRYSSSYSNDRTDSDGFVSYLNSYGNHDAGEECYKIKTDQYSY